jgi:glycosyltransferase involved in cell wall biosynthesis
MEAMAREKPVVATRVGGVPEVVADGNTGVLVQPGDPAALAEGIEALLRDPERAHQMGQRGRRRVAERFDLHQMLERTKQVYAGLLREQIKTKGGAT